MRKNFTSFPGIWETFNFWGIGSTASQGKTLHARLDLYDKNGEHTNNNTKYSLTQPHSQLAQVVQVAES